MKRGVAWIPSANARMQKVPNNMAKTCLVNTTKDRIAVLLFIDVRTVGVDQIIRGVAYLVSTCQACFNPNWSQSLQLPAC